MSQAPTTRILPPVDPDVGLQRALDRALADGSNAALILFIARNPDEPAADQARAALAARHDPDPRPFPGPDGDIIGAFDRARLAGPEALAPFAGTFAGHPLAAEANRPFWH